MTLSRRALIAWFAALAAFWYFAFATDAGNFWHGGTDLGLILTEAAAVLGVFAFLEILRSNASVPLKVILGIFATPLAIFVAGAIVYAAKYLLAV